MFFEQFERERLVALGERAVAHHVREHDGREFALLAGFGRHERIKPDRARNEMANTPTLYPLSPNVTQSPDSFGQRGLTKALENRSVWATIRHDSEFLAAAGSRLGLTSSSK